MSPVVEALRAAFGVERVLSQVPLAPFTTFRTGGPAEWFIETRTSDEILTALRLAHASSTQVTILGGGSNVLIADAGIRGLVIRPRGGVVTRVADDRIRADAALSINGLVRWSINHGCGGLEAWAGTPGTIGGAIFGNTHFRNRLIGDEVIKTRLASPAGIVADVPRERMAFGYDRSRLQQTGEVLLSATFRVSPGEPSELRATARESLAFRKRTQPLDTHNAGCVFQNPDPSAEDAFDGLPGSAGALIDRAGLKGTQVGGARVSAVHANFIVNEGAATARDIRQLIARCRNEVRARFGIDLREEIVYLGDFDR